MPSPTKIPTHIGIICDGNRRWAQEHKLAVFKGHEWAVKHVFEPLILHAQEKGVRYLTFWVFSTENWQRASTEVEYLLDLFRTFYEVHAEKLGSKNIRVTSIGDRSAFPTDIQDSIKRAEAKTAHNTGLTVIFALNYGGRDEIVRAVNKVVAARYQQGLSADQTVTESEVAQCLDTASIPDPDLIIRTSGEQRLSGFLPWQAVYAELYFPNYYFPELTPEKFDEALAEYQARQRRFGK